MIQFLPSLHFSMYQLCSLRSCVDRLGNSSALTRGCPYLYWYAIWTSSPVLVRNSASMRLKYSGILIPTASASSLYSLTISGSKHAVTSGYTWRGGHEFFWFPSWGTGFPSTLLFSHRSLADTFDLRIDR